jgi:(p)ppGpp synthase/HD superfamily hydrolase
MWPEPHRKELLVNSPRFRQAFEYAAVLHAPDLRKSTKIPYIAHLLDVCSIVLRYGGTEDTAIGALLHDAAEDHGGESRLADIRRNFGPTVERIVRECTDSVERQKEPWERRKKAYLKHLPKASSDAMLVSAADKLSNAQGILADHYAIGDAVFKRFGRPKQRTLWYYNALADVFAARLRGNLPKALRRTVSELNRRAGYKAAGKRRG